MEWRNDHINICCVKKFGQDLLEVRKQLLLTAEDQIYSIIQAIGQKIQSNELVSKIVDPNTERETSMSGKWASILGFFANAGVMLIEGFLTPLSILHP